jgi:AmiR/NasT family two-component response regulator
VLNQIEEQELVGLAVPDPIRTRLEAAERENSQLREALATRIIIEQAKGVLAERFGLNVGEAFELLRRSARSERQRIHDLAAEVVSNRHTPPRIQALAAEVRA